MSNLYQDVLNDILSCKLFTDDRGNIYGPQYEPYLSHTTGVWQIPEELAGLVEWLADKNVCSFLNVGTFNGATFNLISKYIKKFNTGACCISIDPINHNPVMADGLIYENKTSFDYIGRSFDLVFIDGDHTYECVKQDFDNVGKHARYCVFHDIRDKYIGAMACGGVVRFWEEIKTQYGYHEFVFGENKIMGIGILDLIISGGKNE